MINQCLDESVELPDDVGSVVEFLYEIAQNKTHPVSTALFEAIDLIKGMQKQINYLQKPRH